MEFRGMLRRVAGAGAALAAVGTVLLAPAATAVPADNIVKILHASTRTCLDSNDQGHVYTLGCPDEVPISQNQKWNNYAPGKFKNLATGKCLAGSNGGSAYTTGDCDNAAVFWHTDGTSPTYIRHDQHPGFCLNGAGGSPQAVGITSCSSSTRWSIKGTPR